MKFSIIMPTYNCERYVAEAVNSVLGQTYKDFELIIVDDGSQDGTFAVCEQLAKDKDNVHLFAAEHGGVSRARNFGLKKSQGDYVLFIDSDDSWENNLLERASEALTENDELLVFGYRSDYYLSDGTFQYSNKKFGDEGKIVELPENYSVDSVFSSYNMAAPWNKVYKRDIIEKNELNFSEKCVYLEDLKFNFDYLRYASNIKTLKSDLYHYRLFSDKKQMLKRQFNEWFVNADELFYSCINFLNNQNTALESEPILVGVLTTAYGKEFTARTYGVDRKTQLQALLSLKHNPNFQELLRVSHGKFFKLYKVLNKLGFCGLQIKLLKRRFD